MGPTLAVLARRAAEAARHKLDVIAVSRFSILKHAAGWKRAGSERSVAICSRETRAEITAR